MGKFNDLPSDTMLDIFTRLPAESLLDCKSVSKTWKNVLQHPSFVQMHSDRLLLSNLDSSADSGKFNFIFHMAEDPSEPYSRRLYYLEYDDVVSSHRLRKLILNPPFELYSIVGSYNGLICIKGFPNHYTILESSTYVAFICNPITRECITLPELDRDTYYHGLGFMSGFGYVASTNEYKVVRLYTFRGEYKFAQIEVYTLGSGKGWRNAGKIKVDSSLLGRQHAVFVNGFLYWDFGSGRIMAFDLAGEIFVGYSELENGRLRFGVLGGYCCGTIYSQDGNSSDIWLLKKKKEDESLSWSKEFSLIDTKQYTTPLALTASGRVLCYSDKKLSLYDLKSSSSTLLEDFGGKINRTIPHMNSLVSLKAFGEDNTKTLEFGECNRRPESWGLAD